MTFTITTPLYYVNDKPHLGSTYTTIACDALARYHRLNGQNVLFITGVDEHGQKIQRTAIDKGLEPQNHCDLISLKYQKLWSDWDIKYDSFVRTTSQSHINFVHQFFNRVNESGDIRIGRQQGWYCVGCEEYKDTPKNAIHPECNIHRRELEWRDEQNLFFRLSKYQKRIEELVSKEDFISPKSRKKEIINFVSNGLNDFSISRVNVQWGIPVPGYTGHTFYVWFDALLGYLSGTLYANNEINLQLINDNGWPASIHVIGKDILRFHAVYWPAMLMSAGIELPKKIFGHGFLTREGQKMGKSLGNVIEPEKLLDIFGRDSTRWYLLRDIEFGQDGDFQQQRFVDIVNNDLSNTIGNLLNRTSTMSRKWFNNKVPPITGIQKDKILKILALKTIETYNKEIVNLNFKLASESIINLATKANTYLNEMEPWKKIKQDNSQDDVATIIYSVLEVCRIIGYLLQPLTPDLSNRILEQLSIETPITSWKNQLNWGLLSNEAKLPDPSPVMSKLETNDNL